MRLSVTCLAGILMLGFAGTALAHHKPGHAGGPPWTRERMSRQDWLDTRPAYRSSCITRYRETYDPYRGYVVRRPVQVCR